MSAPEIFENALTHQPWEKSIYYLLTEEVKRIDKKASRKKTKAEKGIIVEWTDTFRKFTTKDCYGKDGSVEYVPIFKYILTDKVLVPWSEWHMVPITNEEKELLEAVKSPKDRCNIYREQYSLMAAKEITVGCDVEIKASVLKRTNDVTGLVLFKGDLNDLEKPGTHFGVRFNDPIGNSDGKYHGIELFSAKPKHAVVVSMENIRFVQPSNHPLRIPHSQAGGNCLNSIANVEEVLSSSKHVGRTSHTTDVSKESLRAPGTSSARHYIVGDIVVVPAKLNSCLSTNTWVEGKVVGIKHYKNDLLACVELVNKNNIPGKYTHGMWKGEAVFSPKNATRTVTLLLSDVCPKTGQSSQTSPLAKTNLQMRQNVIDAQDNRNIQTSQPQSSGEVRYRDSSERVGSFGKIRSEVKGKLNKIAGRQKPVEKGLSLNLEHSRSTPVKTYGEIANSGTYRDTAGVSTTTSLTSRDAPDAAVLDNSFLTEVGKKVRSSWSDLARELGVGVQQMHEFWQYSEQERAIKMLIFWRNEQPRSTEMLEMLIKACRKASKNGLYAHMNKLANEMEQGLTEHLLNELAEKVTIKTWRKLGENLGLSKSKLNAFQRMQGNTAKQRVYCLLRYWRFIQPFNSDKAEALAVAFLHCNFETEALRIRRSLHVEQLEAISPYIAEGHRRHIICSDLLDLSTDEVQEIEKHELDAQKIYHALLMWKKTQPPEKWDLCKELFQILMKAKLCFVARMLYDGLDEETVIRLAKKITFDWQPLAYQLGYLSKDIRLFTFGQKAPEDISLEMLRDWIRRNKQEKNKVVKLCSCLELINRKDISDWLEEADDREDAIKGPIPLQLLKKVAEKLDCSSDKLRISLNLTTENVMVYGKFKGAGKKKVMLLEAWMVKNKGIFSLDELLQKLAQTFENLNNYEAADFIIQELSLATKRTQQSDAALAATMEVDLGLSSIVQVDWGGETLSGTIQWIGEITDLKEHGEIAGIELDNSPNRYRGDRGYFGKEKFFDCADSNTGFFIPLSRCKADPRFLVDLPAFHKNVKTKEDFGNFECFPIEGHVLPFTMIPADFVGMVKGIQGDHNSCYMDVTLYSMFAFSDVFDDILRDDDLNFLPEANEVKTLLRESIVNPLRVKGFVRADKVLAFRELLGKLSKLKGLTREEKDPEEFLHVLLQELLNAKPFLAIRHGTAKPEDSFIYQIFLEKTDDMKIPTVEQLLVKSFFDNDLKLTKPPECLIIQLPRYGKSYKMFDWILPCLEIDIAPIIENYPRQCGVCGVEMACIECSDCTKVIDNNSVIGSLCQRCFDQIHNEAKQNHKWKRFVSPSNTPDEHSSKMRKRGSTSDMFPKQRMELFAFLCIHTSHYVAFVKAGSGENAEWVFFDSMADRRGEQCGYNVPEITHLIKFEETIRNPQKLLDQLHDPSFPNYMKRLLGDGYICFYKKSSSVNHSERVSEECHRTHHGHSQSNLSGSDSGSIFSAPIYDNLPDEELKLKLSPTHFITEQTYSHPKNQSGIVDSFSEHQPEPMDTNVDEGYDVITSKDLNEIKDPPTEFCHPLNTLV